MKEEKSEHERARQYEIAIQLVCARHCELPLSKMGSKGLFPVVAVPLAFFGTFFRFERKYWTPSGRQPHRPRRSRRVSPPRQEICACGRTKGLSSGQTIGAARTAVRSACCLPELRVISAFGGQPTGLIFPSVPPCGFAYRKETIHQVPPPRRSRSVKPHRGSFLQQSWLAPQLAEGPSKLSNVITQKSIAAEINMSPLKIRL